MPFYKIYLHFVWSTKNRFPYLISKEIREAVWDHMATNAKLKNIRLISVGGHQDHCHCLISLTKEDHIAKMMQLIKGESSYWINKSGMLKSHFKEKFDWQDEYFVESISPGAVHIIQQYILTQDIHHQKFSFEEEYEKLITEFNIKN